MKSRSGEKIKLTSIDELLGVVNEESAMEIEINRIHAFKDHPFKVLDDEKMADLVESVKTYGVLTPVLLRSDGENGYEMISGHRRMHAAVIAGLATNTMQEGTRLFGTLPFLLYTVLQVALFVFRILLLHSDRLSGYRLHIFHRVPAFLPVFLRFSDVSGHNPVPVLNSIFYLDIPLS